MINLIETNEKEKINSFIERINANILKEIFSNCLFLFCFTNYLSKQEKFDLDVVCRELKLEYLHNKRFWEFPTKLKNFML